MTRALFIRHGQSTANVGQPTEDFDQVPLTALGRQQALDLAASWTITPSLIAVSPFLRAQQTAAATIARFPHVPVETWPIHEFTLWDPDHWADGEPKDMMHDVDVYWTGADAELRYGANGEAAGAESFAMLLQRAKSTLEQLQTMRGEEQAPVMVFTHGHFIQAVRLTVLHPDWSASRTMSEFRAFDEAQWVKNTQVIPAEFDGTRWQMD